jgi:hypothetical protein
MKKSSASHVLGTMNCCTSQIHSDSKHPYIFGRPPGIEIIHSKACLPVTEKTTKKQKSMPQVGLKKMNAMIEVSQIENMTYGNCQELYDSIQHKNGFSRS